MNAKLRVLTGFVLFISIIVPMASVMARSEVPPVPAPVLPAPVVYAPLEEPPETKEGDFSGLGYQEMYFHRAGVALLDCDPVTVKVTWLKLGQADKDAATVFKIKVEFFDGYGKSLDRLPCGDAQLFFNLTPELQDYDTKDNLVQWLEIKRDGGTVTSWHNGNDGENGRRFCYLSEPGIYTLRNED